MTNKKKYLLVSLVGIALSGGSAYVASVTELFGMQLWFGGMSVALIFIALVILDLAAKS